MKALTVKQPWASLIVHDIKDIENRTWACPKKYIGQRVLIHAGADKRGFWDLNDAQIHEFRNSENMLFKQSSTSLPFGVIIGSVEIVDCVINHPSVWAEKTENYTVGMNPKLHENITGKKPIYNWVLANPVLFEKPIPAKGRLSFWEHGSINSEDDICLCGIPVEENNQVAFICDEYRCRYCGCKWHK